MSRLWRAGICFLAVSIGTGSVPLLAQTNPDAGLAARGHKPVTTQAAGQDAGQQRGEQPFEFSDAPDFRVAGITDWTAVGGHGSDATLRTSEDLARDTSLLVEPALQERSKAPVALDPEQESRLREGLAAAPRSYALHHELGELYLRAGHFREAVPLLQTASLLNGNAAEDEYAVAQACAGVGDLHEARRHVAAAIDKQENAKFWLLAGEIDEKLGNPLEAVREEQRAAQLDPSEENYLVWAAELLRHRAVWQATDVLAKGSQLFPRSSRMRAEWGAALFAGARYDEAARRLCEASDLQPTSREPYLLLGKAVLGSPAPLPCATEALDRFLRLRPDDADARYYDAMQLLKSHERPASAHAANLLQLVVKADPGYADAWVQLGILATAGRGDAEAQQDFLHALAADPQQAEAHYRLGVLYERVGRHAEAQQEFHTHEVLAKEQADAAERERRQVQQFLVVPEKGVAEARKP